MGVYHIQESKLLGILLPTLPDFLPIVEGIREKFDLPELSPDDEPIKDIFLGDVQVSLEDFWLEIKSLVQEKIDLLPPELDKIVTQATAFDQTPVNMVTAGWMPD